MWLSRIRVKQEEGLKALGPVLLPDEEEQRISLGHRMMWSLFPDMKEEQEGRPFLWREEQRGRFIILSRQQPSANSLMEVSDTREFSPDISPMESLNFRLRANPTIARKTAGARGVRSDIVMNAIKELPKAERARLRNHELGWGENEQGYTLPMKAPRDWLDRQGQLKGFTIEKAMALSYQVLRVPHENRGDKKRKNAPLMTFGIIDFEGTLKVENPEKFIEALCAGIGRAKAFGCGLMLIKRAS